MTDHIDAIIAGMSEAQKRAATVLMSYHDCDTPCLNAKHLAERMETASSPDDARVAVRALVVTGLARVETGLVREDGDFYGSGWLLTPLGLQVRERLGGAK